MKEKSENFSHRGHSISRSSTPLATPHHHEEVHDGIVVETVDSLFVNMIPSNEEATVASDARTVVVSNRTQVSFVLNGQLQRTKCGRNHESRFQVWN